MDIKTLDDIKKINIDELSGVDPTRIRLGTCLQDSTLITQAFESGAHATPTEAATFATLNRSLENQIAFADSAIPSLQGYLKSPQERSDKESLVDYSKQGFNIDNAQQPTLGSESFGETLLDFARDCIPCSLRLLSFIELNPNIDLLGTLEADIFNRLKFLADVGSMFKNFDIYADFCDMLGLLSFMCIPDLQRLIAMLMALLVLELPTLEGLIGLIQGLIAPLFAPILMAITSLLDQFVLVVTNPLDCILDAINLQMRKLSFETGNETSLEKAARDINTGLSDLNKMVSESKQKIQEKLNFYVDEVKAMLGDLNGGDGAYLVASLKKLATVRMVGFIVAIINALTRGHVACSSVGKTPERSELDNFFDNFLNPNSPFNMWVDDNDQIHIDEKSSEFEDIANSPTGSTNLPDLPNNGNVFQFEGDPLVDTTIFTQQIISTKRALVGSASAIIPCKLETSITDVDKVNQFISELNQA